MLTSPSAVLMAFVLSGAAAIQPDAMTCETGVRHLELPAIPGKEPPAICISPGRPTLFNFDEELVVDSVSLEGRDDFALVEQGRSTLKLVPSEKLTAGRRLLLTARYRDSAAPVSAAFMLVVQAVQAEPLVNVYRQARSVESYEQELEESRAKVRQCREENAQLRAEHAGPGGIMGLRASELMAADGIRAWSISEHVTLAPANAFAVFDVIAYSSAKRVAVEVNVRGPVGTPAWAPTNATLVLQGRKGIELKVVKLWPLEPIVPGPDGRTVFVEAEAPVAPAAGTYLFKLSDASGARSVTLGNVTFP